MVNKDHTDDNYNLGFIVQPNVGYDSFLRSSLRKFPNVVLIGGGRCSGKTTLQKALRTLADQERRRMHIIHSLASREKRPVEQMHPKVRSHEFRTRDDIQRELDAGRCYLAYEFGQNLYAFPKPGHKVKSRFFSPLEKIAHAYERKKIKDPNDFSSERPIPLYVVSTTSPEAYDQLREIFPYSVSVVTCLDQSNETQLELRIRKRITDQLAQANRRITRAEFEAAVEKELPRALITNVAFRRRMETADVYFSTSDPTSSQSTSDIDQMVARESKDNASRLLRYADLHTALYYTHSRIKPASTTVSGQYAQQRMRTLFGDNIDELLQPSTEQKFDANLIADHEQLITVLKDLELNDSWFRQTYTMPMRVTQKPDGGVDICFRYMKTDMPHDSLNNSEWRFLQILGKLAGGCYRAISDKSGIRIGICFTLTDDITAPRLTIQYKSKISTGQSTSLVEGTDGRTNTTNGKENKYANHSYVR